MSEHLLMMVIKYLPPKLKPYECESFSELLVIYLTAKLLKLLLKRGISRVKKHIVIVVLSSDTSQSSRMSTDIMRKHENVERVTSKCVTLARLTAMTHDWSL